MRRSRTLIEDDTKSAELHWLRQRAALMNQNGRWRAWEERWGGHDSYHSVQLGEISWLAARTFPVECAKLCLIDSEMWRPPKTCWVLILDVQPRCYEPVLNHLEINTPPPEIYNPNGTFLTFYYNTKLRQ